MKRLLLVLLIPLLPSCVTDAATGKRVLSPEFNAAIGRVSVSVLTAAEAALIAKINDQLRADDGK